MSDEALPAHGPGCKPLALPSRRFPGEPRYVCAANCPRRKALARMDRVDNWVTADELALAAGALSERAGRRKVLQVAGHDGERSPWS